MGIGDAIPEGLLGRLVSGLNLVPGTLRDQLGTGLNLLVFLRQFGCIFCRETLADVRVLVETEPRFPTPLFFFEGTPTVGKAFLRRYWPGLRAVADPNAEFYEGFGIERGSLIRTLGPGVWSARSRAESRGHRSGERSGDVWRMPGVFLARGEEIVWSHRYRHAGDRPDYQLICQVAAAQD